MLRRRFLKLLFLAGWPPAQPRPLCAAPPAFPAVTPRPLVFPRDHGAHPEFRTEWWYLTGWLETSTSAETLGFQITFFRSRTTHDTANPSRFAPHQLLFAHAALARPRLQHLLHDQRAARVVRDDAAATFSVAETDLALAGWRLRRTVPGAYEAEIAAADFAFELRFEPTQPLLLQGDNGYSRKGPQPTQASYYYSLPQLAVSGIVGQDGERLRVEGRAWLDHEWASQVLDPGAAGWDWLGINLDDGGALMAFRIRARDGSAPLWATARLRLPDGRERSFAADEVRFETDETWRSPRTGTSYPIRGRLILGQRENAQQFEFVPLIADQELDARRSTGAVYWEGAVTLLSAGKRCGRGYLELVGYHRPMRL